VNVAEHPEWLGRRFPERNSGFEEVLDRLRSRARRQDGQNESNGLKRRSIELTASNIAAWTMSIIHCGGYGELPIGLAFMEPNLQLAPRCARHGHEGP